MFKRIGNMLKDKRGFTLIELVVVIAIIAVLMSVLVPSVSGYIDTARDTAAMANAKLVYTTAAALVPIWDMAERPSYSGSGSADDRKRTYAERYLALDNINGGKRLGDAIVGENFLRGSANEGSISLVYQNGQVVSATFTYSESKGGKSATYSIADRSIIVK